MVHEFSCIKGCTDCCTLVDSVPVTFGDLARVWLYDNIAGKSFYQIFEEHCSGWNALHSPGLIAFYMDDLFERQEWQYWPVPKAKNPCTYLDSQNKGCKGHTKLKYSACRAMPEIMVVLNQQEMELPAHLLELFEQLPCIEDAVLSEEKTAEVLKENDMLAREIYLTGKMMGCKGWSRQEAVFKFKPEELSAKVQYLSQKLESAEKTQDEKKVYDIFVNLADRNVRFMF